MTVALTAAAPAASGEDVLQSLADATLIDAECRTTNTMYGAVFRYGEAHGVPMNDIMILGKRRKEFEAALAQRRGNTPHEEICGFLQARYMQNFPSWFRSR